MQRVSFFRWIYLLMTNSFRFGWLCLLVKMWFDQKTVNEIVPEEYNIVKQHAIGRYIFLTHLNQVAHKVAFFALLCADLGFLKWEKASKLFQSFVIPQTTTIFVIYWAMFMKDPSLVRNPKTIEYIPENLDFLLHTAIVPAMVNELIMGRHQIKIRRSMKDSFIFLSTYCIVCISYNVSTGIWPYGFLEKLGLYKAFSILTPLYFIVCFVALCLAKLVSKISFAIVPEKPTPETCKTD